MDPDPPPPGPLTPGNDSTVLHQPGLPLEVDMYDLDVGSDTNAMLQLDSFSFQASPTRNPVVWDSPIEEIAPDSNVISSLELIQLASQFGQTNIESQRIAATDSYRESKPSTSPSSPTKSTTAIHKSSRPLQSRNSSHNDRRVGRQSLARLQSRLEKLAELNPDLQDKLDDPTTQPEGTSVSYPDLQVCTHRAPSTLPPTPGPSSPEPYMDMATLASIANFRRSKDVGHKPGYVMKQVRMRRERLPRLPLTKSLPS